VVQPLLSDMDQSPSIRFVGGDVDSHEANRIYALSFETEAIDHFISHSWSAGGFWKWLALCELFHSKFAVGFSLAWWLASACVAIGTRLATGLVVPFAFAVVVHVITPAGVLLFSLAQGHKSFGSTCFLDKLCVHQVDNELKTAGMNSMGDCLQASRHLTILWSDDYFERLWCVFEIAAFAHSMRESEKSIEFKPLWIPPFLVGLTACNVLVVMGCAMLLGSPLFYTNFMVLGESLGLAVVWAVCTIVPGLFICSLTRRKLRRVQSLLEWIATFRIDQTKVTDERDRRVLYRQIRRMFGSLTDFEEYVRTDFRETVLSAVGRPGATRYEWAFIMYMPYAWFATVDTTSMLPEGITAQLGSANVVKYLSINYGYYISHWCVVGPLVLRGLSLGQYYSRSLSATPALVLDVILYQLLSFSLNWALIIVVLSV